jgi:hypothetical protein
MASTVSDCKLAFGYADFDAARVAAKLRNVCPVDNCSTTLIPVPYRKKSAPWCPTHGIRLHPKTFVYWNGFNHKTEAVLRNFIVREDLVESIVLVRGAKAESDRLGSEMSEDALTWNVFVRLAETNGLRAAAEHLTGRTLSTEPDLYLWGQRIDLSSAVRGVYAPLIQVRDCLETTIRGFRTEPDIMLVAQGEMIVCIEAKFGSGNTLAHGISEEDKDQQKPTSRQGLLTRYLGGNTSQQTRTMIQQDKIGSVFHSQLFRNIVFAAEMAGPIPWHVVNLVSSTQRPVREKRHVSFDDPTSTVRAYLQPSQHERFTWRTWENLYAARIRDKPELMKLGLYMRGKSAHYRPAFKLA